MTNSPLGRWDLTIHHPDGDFPNWVDIRDDGGWFVGQFGSARPILLMRVEGDNFDFSLPKQYEGRTNDLRFTGKAEGDQISGQYLSDQDAFVPFSGVRAPVLAPTDNPTFGDPIELIGSDLSGWHARSPDWVNHWAIRDGFLTNAGVGSDLITDAKFQDFKLVAEYSYPEGSNSGIYLRGRYEYQVYDDYGQAPGVGSSAAIYGFLTPSANAIHPHGMLNRAEITLLGRFVSVVLNGDLVIDNAEIPGITGGALDSDEGTPGPFLIQGDHGPVTYHRLTVYPVI